MSNIGSSKIAEIYAGSTKIAKAYLGSTLVFQLVQPTPQPSFDSVQIGDQIWMSKNLTIDDGQGNIYTQTVNYGQGDVVEYYYRWDAAVRVAASIQGWHLPTADEFDALAAAVGGSATAGTKLKSTYGWTSGNGSDDYGFTAFPAGRRVQTSDSFSNFGSRAYFWTATQSSSSKAYYRYFSTGASMSSYNDYKSTYFYSVRLVKDT